MCIQVYVYLRLRVHVNVLQCVAVCCSVLPCVAVCGSVLQVHVGVYSGICLFNAAGICV